MSSESLRFDPKNKLNAIYDFNEDENDLDRALANIRNLMINKNLKL